MRTVHTSERTNFISMSLFIPLSLQIGTRSSIIFLAIPIRHLVFLQQWPSADFSNPSYLKCSTTSICSSSTIYTPASDCILPVVRSLVSFTFNFSSLDFTIMLLTLPIDLSASSFDCTKIGVACVSQIRAHFPPILITISSISACRITDSVYKFKICGERMQPCLTPLSIVNALQ